jgi:hypothetical protein
VNAIQKLLSSLKNAPQKPHRALKVFGNRFAVLHTKLDADTLLDFAIHCRQNRT